MVFSLHGIEPAVPATENIDGHDTANEQGDEEHGNKVPAVVAKDAELCPSLSAVVAAALHGRSQLIRPTEGRGEQRNDYGDQRLGALGQTSRGEVGAPRLLGGHDLVRLLHDGGDES